MCYLVAGICSVINLGVPANLLIFALTRGFDVGNIIWSFVSELVKLYEETRAMSLLSYSSSISRAVYCASCSALLL